MWQAFLFFASVLQCEASLREKSLRRQCREHYFSYMKQQLPRSPRASLRLLGVLLSSLLVLLAFAFPLISLPCVVSPGPDIDFLDSPMGVGPCSFLLFSMIFKGLGFFGFLGFVLESERA